MKKHRRFLTWNPVCHSTYDWRIASLRSAPGALDTTFGNGGIGLSTFANPSLSTSVLFQSNSDIIVVSMFPQKADGARYLHLAH
jgi:hypothetical protein